MTEHADTVFCYRTQFAVRVRHFFDRLRRHNLTLQTEKAEFLKETVTYLGHIISVDGVRPNPKQVEAVAKFPVPKNRKNVRQFLGLVNYYRRFIPNFSKRARPLSILTSTKVDFRWGKEQQESFEDLRKALYEKPVLQYPDFTKPFIINADASDIAVGAVLSQGEIGKDPPIAYASKALKKNQLNWSTIEKECYAIIYAVHHFHTFVHGQKFTIVTDHQPLQWLFSVKKHLSRLIRWRGFLEKNDYAIAYKPGRVNANADALSRNPVPHAYPVAPSQSSRSADTNTSCPRNARSSAMTSKQPVNPAKSKPKARTPAIVDKSAIVTRTRSKALSGSPTTNITPTASQHSSSQPQRAGDTPSERMPLENLPTPDENPEPLPLTDLRTQLQESFAKLDRSLESRHGRKDEPTEIETKLPRRLSDGTEVSEEVRETLKALDPLDEELDDAELEKRIRALNKPGTKQQNFPATSIHGKPSVLPSLTLNNDEDEPGEEINFPLPRANSRTIMPEPLGLKGQSEHLLKPTPSDKRSKRVSWNLPESIENAPQSVKIHS